MKTKSLLITTKITGGAGKACLRLHKGLRKLQYDSHILTSVLDKNNISDYIHSPYRQNQKFYNFQHDLFLKLCSNEAYEPLSTPFKITNQTCYQNSDIVNIHWSSRFLDYNSFFTTNTKPIVYTLHDMQSFTGGFAYDHDDNGTLIKKLYQRNLEIKKRLLPNHDITIIAPSQWLVSKSKSSELFQKYSHHCIPNGIDTSIFKNTSKSKARSLLNLPKDKKIILFVAQSFKNKRKGFKMLLESMDDASFDNTMLLAVGNLKSKVSYNINSTGFIIDEDKMALHYSAADLFIIPSREDNLPNTIVESLCCGTPVVGFNIGGVPEMVTHLKNGIIVDQISSKDLRVGIRLGLTKEWNNQLISEKAMSKYDEKIQAKNYITLFEKILRK